MSGQLINPHRVISAKYRCQYRLVGHGDDWFEGSYEGPDRDEAVEEARTRWRNINVAGVRVIEQLTRVAEERVKTR